MEKDTIKIKESKNIVKINENALRQIVMEGVKSVLREFDEFDDDFDNEEELFYIGTLAYKLDTEQIEDITGMPFNDVGFETYNEAVACFKHMCSYPEQSSEYDIRYANNSIPLFYIYKNQSSVNNKLYLSAIDVEYKPKIQQCLENDGYGDSEIVIVNP